MQYYIPTQDVLGALSDVFSKCNYQFDSSKHSESLEKLASTFQSRMDTNKFKSNLDKYIEKVKCIKIYLICRINLDTKCKWWFP